MNIHGDSDETNYLSYAGRPTTEDEDVEEREDEVFEEIIVDEEEAEELLEEKLEERDSVEEVFMEAAVGEVENVGGNVQSLSRFGAKVSDEKEDDADIEEEEKMGEEDRGKEESEVEEEMEAVDEEEQLKPALVQSLEEDDDDEKKDEEEDEDEEDEFDDTEEEEEKETNETEVEEKMHMEESLEKEIESQKEEGDGGKIVSLNVRVREDVFVNKEVTETSTTLKSRHVPKTEKAEKTIAVELSTSAVELDSMKKKRTFRKFSYRGVDLDQLLDLSLTQVVLKNPKIQTFLIDGLDICLVSADRVVHVPRAKEVVSRAEEEANGAAQKAAESKEDR